MRPRWYVGTIDVGGLQTWRTGRQLLVFYLAAAAKDRMTRLVVVGSRQKVHNLEHEHIHSINASSSCVTIFFIRLRYHGSPFSHCSTCTCRPYHVSTGVACVYRVKKPGYQYPLLRLTYQPVINNSTLCFQTHCVATSMDVSLSI